MKIKTLLIAISSTLALSTTAIAHENQSSNQERQLQGQQQQDQRHHRNTRIGETKITDEKLENFADAMVDINKVSGTYNNGRVKESLIREENQITNIESQDEIVEAIEDNGLTIEEYRNIQLMAQRDPRLMERIVDLYEERNGENHRAL